LNQVSPTHQADIVVRPGVRRRGGAARWRKQRSEYKPSKRSGLVFTPFAFLRQPAASRPTPDARLRIRVHPRNPRI